MRINKLSESEIADRLSRMPGWDLLGEEISKTFDFKNFVQSMEFVNVVAETAEQIQHHPDITIRYNKVTIALTTHDAKGLTDSDFSLASVAEEFADSTLAAVH